MRLMQSHAFVLCAEGGGVDPSPKAWQAILHGAIPIIRRDQYLPGLLAAAGGLCHGLESMVTIPMSQLSTLQRSFPNSPRYQSGYRKITQSIILLIV